jgi:hypothetical protein
MDLDIQHELGHAALIWTCSVDMDMLHGHDFNRLLDSFMYMYNVHIDVHAHHI